MAMCCQILSCRIPTIASGCVTACQQLKEVFLGKVSLRNPLTQINLWHFLCIFLSFPRNLTGIPSLKIDPQEAFFGEPPYERP